MFISFDPNLREPLWASLDDARREIEYGLSVCDILKISDNKLEFMTGAGDTFTGCMLSFLLDCGIKNLTEEKLKELLIFANAGASLITTKKGALKVMPERVEIEALIKGIK